MDRGAIERERDQLWAEDVHRFNAGEAWWFVPGEDDDALPSLVANQDEARVVDAAEEILASWLRTEPGSLSLDEISRGAFADLDGSRPASRNLSKYLKALGWEPRRT